MVEWYRRRVHHMVVSVPVIFTIVVSLTAVVLLLRSRSPPSSTLFLAPRHPSLSGTWKRKLLNLFSYLILHTLISTLALAYSRVKHQYREAADFLVSPPGHSLNRRRGSLRSPCNIPAVLYRCTYQNYSSVAMETGRACQNCSSVAMETGRMCPNYSYVAMETGRIPCARTPPSGSAESA